MKLHGREHQVTTRTALDAYMKASAALEQVLTTIENNRPTPFDHAVWLRSLKTNDPIRTRFWGFTVYFRALRPAGFLDGVPVPAGVEYTLTLGGKYCGNWDIESAISPVAVSPDATKPERIAEAEKLLQATAEMEYAKGRLDALLGEVNTSSDAYTRGVLDEEASHRAEY